jgi:ATP-dependent Clp protease ATP-binding subunit ClpA
MLIICNHCLRESSFLRERDSRNAVVQFDELDKGETSLFKCFLQLFEDGKLFVPSKPEDPPVNCSNSVFLVTTNWGQDEVLSWYSSNKDKFPKDGEIWSSSDSFTAGKQCREPVAKVCGIFLFFTLISFVLSDFLSLSIENNE